VISKETKSMSREMEYDGRFGAMSCSEPGDRPTISDAEDEPGFSNMEEEPSADAGERPGISDEESTGAGA
jgi:hypothetical protein